MEIIMQSISKFLVKSIKQVQRVLNTTQSTTSRQAASGSWRFSLSQGWLVMLLPVVLVLTSCGGGGGGGGDSTPAATTAPTTAPDLTISNFKASSSSPVVSTPITFSVTFTNKGDAEAASGGTLTYYQSTDNTITGAGNDTAIGSAVKLSAISAESGSNTFSHRSPDITAPDTEGTYYYGACVSHDDDSDAANNCSSAAEVEVEAAPAPDISLSSASAVPDTVVTEASFDFSVTVSNTGSAPQASSSTLRVYRSADATLTPDSDEEVATETVDALADKASFDSSSTIVAPAAVGTYHYYACVDEDADDANPSKNCSSSVEVVVNERRPDLKMSPFSVIPSSPKVSATIELSVTITNEGSANAASGGSITYYRSSDATITSGDISVGFGSLPAIDQGSSFSPSAEITAPAATGTYYYGACVSHADNSSGAIICSSAEPVQVEEAATPDLNLRSASAVPNARLPGESFDFSITVQNTGTANADRNGSITYYQSSDSTISTSDLRVGSSGILEAIAKDSSLPPQSVTITAPATEGTYYYGACVSHADDANTSNDCSTGIAVLVARPNLLVENPAVSADVILKDTVLTVSVEVRNTGGLTAASGGTLDYYQSTDDTITDTDTKLNSVSETLPTISVGDSTDRMSFEATSPDTAGTYYYGACVSHDDDTRNTNDCSSAVAVQVVNTASAISAGENPHLCHPQHRRRQGAGEATADGSWATAPPPLKAIFPCRSQGGLADVTAISAGV